MTQPRIAERLGAYADRKRPELGRGPHVVWWVHLLGEVLSVRRGSRHDIRHAAESEVGEGRPTLPVNLGFGLGCDRSFCLTFSDSKPFSGMGARTLQRTACVISLR